MRFYQLPFFLPFLYPNRLWNGHTSERKISLTFDDGPVPGITDWVLEELEKRGMRATFFMVGDNVRKYPALAQTVLAAGHQLGNLPTITFLAGKQLHRRIWMMLQPAMRSLPTPLEKPLDFFDLPMAGLIQVKPRVWQQLKK